MNRYPNILPARSTSSQVRSQPNLQQSRELSLTQPLFRKWWGARNVTRQEFGTKTVRHPELGEFVIDWDGFSWAVDPDQQLVVWSAQPGSATEEKFRILSSWIAAPHISEHTDR